MVGSGWHHIVSSRKLEQARASRVSPSSPRSLRIPAPAEAYISLAMPRHFRPGQASMQQAASTAAQQVVGVENRVNHAWLPFQAAAHGRRNGLARLAA